MDSLHNTNKSPLTLKNTKVLFKLAPLLCFFFLGCQTSNQKVSEIQPSSFHLQSRDGSYISHTDPFMKARMNAPYFYLWLRKKEQKDLETKSLLQTQGIVGDSHFLNYSDWISAKGGRILRLSDPDDHGPGPFFAEIIRFSTVALSSPYKLSAAELVDHYLIGLSGRPAPATAEVKVIENLSEDESRLKQQKYIKGLYTFENDIYTFTKKAKSTPITEAEPDLKKYYSKIRRDLLFWLERSHFEPLLEGYSVKKDGGSAGYPRFHFLVEDEQKQIHLIEFKYQPPQPAVGFFNPKQPRFPQRLESVEQSWIGEDLGTTFDAIDIEHDQTVSQFYIRERVKSAFDLEDIQNPEIMKKNILYLAQQIGYWSSKYQKTAVDEISKNLLNSKLKSKTRAKLIALIEDYQHSLPQ